MEFLLKRAALRATRPNHLFESGFGTPRATADLAAAWKRRRGRMVAGASHLYDDVQRLSASFAIEGTLASQRCTAGRRMQLLVYTAPKSSAPTVMVPISLHVTSFRFPAYWIQELQAAERSGAAAAIELRHDRPAAVGAAKAKIAGIWVRLMLDPSRVDENWALAAIRMRPGL